MRWDNGLRRAKGSEMNLYIWKMTVLKGWKSKQISELLEASVCMRYMIFLFITFTLCGVCGGAELLSPPPPLFFKKKWAFFQGPYRRMSNANWSQLLWRNWQNRTEFANTIKELPPFMITPPIKQINSRNLSSKNLNFQNWRKRSCFTDGKCSSFYRFFSSQFHQSFHIIGKVEKVATLFTRSRQLMKFRNVRDKMTEGSELLFCEFQSLTLTV